MSFSHPLTVAGSRRSSRIRARLKATVLLVRDWEMATTVIGPWAKDGLRKSLAAPAAALLLGHHPPPVAL